MYTYTSSIFNQILQLVPRWQFDKLVGQHESDKSAREFSTFDLFSVLLYAQADVKYSLRDIETCLAPKTNLKLHKKDGKPVRSTVSYRNNNKVPWKFFEDLFYFLLKEFKRGNRGGSLGFPYKIFSLDSTTITLCLAKFDWAYYQTAKGAIKINTLLNNESFLPEFIRITDGKGSDNAVAFEIINKVPKGSFIAMDRLYVDYKLLRNINTNGSFFVTRAKTTTKFDEKNSFEVNEENVLEEKEIKFSSNDSPYKTSLRFIKIQFTDTKTGELKTMSFLTNNFDLSATQIANIYRERRTIEEFFRRIKQHLKIKSFLGISENAVKNQIYVAMIYYLIMRYIAYKGKIEKENYLHLTRLIREFLFSPKHIIELYGFSGKKEKNANQKARNGPIIQKLF